MLANFLYAPSIPYKIIYYTHFEITGDPCNLIGSQQCDLFLNCTIFYLNSILSLAHQNENEVTKIECNIDNKTLCFQNRCNKVVIELCVVQFWSDIMLVISHRTHAARSFDFKITRMISGQIALHSVQLPLFISVRLLSYSRKVDMEMLI